MKMVKGIRRGGLAVQFYSAPQPVILTMFIRIPLCILFIVFLGHRASAAEETPLVVTISQTDSSREIPGDFSGLSYGSYLVGAKGGTRFFSADNAPLIAMFKQLGVKNLRLGGKTGDKKNIPAPSEVDLDHLFAFAKAAGVKVIYTLRFLNGSPEEGASTAGYIVSHYPDQIMCFAMGESPNSTVADFTFYRNEWLRYANAIVANAPGAKFCGPNSQVDGNSTRDFAQGVIKSGRLAFIAEHFCPGGSPSSVRDASVARTELLEMPMIDGYQDIAEKGLAIARSHGVGYRLEEFNSYYEGGAKDVSDTFAASLWALEGLHWWALQGADGVNVHISASSKTFHAPFVPTAKGCAARPLGYALKAFAFGSRGRVLPVIAAPPDFSAYAVLSNDGTLAVTLINKFLGANVSESAVTINPGGKYIRAEAMELTAPNSDLAATSGVTLGGASIEEDGSWTGQWKPLQESSTKGRFVVKVPARSAVVARFLVQESAMSVR